MNKKKENGVGLVIWYNSLNFGTNLQALALYNAVKKIGYEPYIIVGHGLITFCELLKFIKRKFKQLVCKKKSNNLNNKKIANINRCFLPNNINYLNIKGIIRFEINIRYVNTFLVGSDQVWNPNFLSKSFLLNFVPEKKTKCSFASSIGVESIPLKKEKIYKKYLLKFDHISVREKTASDILTPLLRKPIFVSCDPTFLIGPDEWKKFGEDYQSTIKLPKKFIFVYFVTESQDMWDEIEKMTFLYGLPIVNLSLNNKNVPPNVINLDDAGPHEFINALINASFICTDSFHACALSINLNKQFIPFKRFKDNDKNSQNSRLTDLFFAFNIDKCFFEDNMERSSKIINYSIVGPAVESCRKKNIAYLKAILGDKNDISL